ncbi:MAG: hypothetical protein ACP5R4_12860, partial [Armatimonadota bacterium]
MLTDKEIVLTRAGLKKIEEELKHLQTYHRREVAERIRDRPCPRCAPWWSAGWPWS